MKKWFVVVARDWKKAWKYYCLVGLLFGTVNLVLIGGIAYVMYGKQSTSVYALAICICYLLGLLIAYVLRAVRFVFLEILEMLYPESRWRA